MTWHLKALGLATLATMAFGSLIASAAQAERFTAATYPAVLTGKQSTAHVYTFSGGPKIECKTVNNSGVLGGAAESISVTVAEENCSQTIGGVSYSSNTTLKCEGTYTHLELLGATFAQCTSLGGYTHDVETKNALNETTCAYSLEDLGTTETVSHENLGGTSGVKFTYNLTGIPYKLVTGSTLLCGSASGTATYTGTSVYTAKTEGGEPISFDIG